MSAISEQRTHGTPWPNPVPSRGRASDRRRIESAQSVPRWLSPALLLLAVATASIAFGNTTADRILLPIEVLGANLTTESRNFVLQADQADAARSLWLQIHGLHYADQASVRVNGSAWIPLNNNSVLIAEPGKSFGGIGGGFATLTMTVPVPEGTVINGSNSIHFRFNQTDGFASGYRVLAWNHVTIDGKKILAAEDFAEDEPGGWTPPLSDPAAIEAGRDLWRTASLVSSSLPNSPRIQAHCADCHAQDGRDLKYFSFSNRSIIARSSFHGLSTLQGQQIASYIRSRPFPNPGRPWNPPYQPGPGLEEQPLSNWAAGAGLAQVLGRDTDALPYLLNRNKAPGNTAPSNRQPASLNLSDLAKQITPDLFRPDGNLNPREIPIALQLPDWSRWLPRIHPKDAWGQSFLQSEFGTLYGGDESAESKTSKPTLRKLMASAQNADRDLRPVVAAFAQWSKARQVFFSHIVMPGTLWSPEFTDKVYSTQLWQLVKTWEMMQDFALEGRGRELFGVAADSRTWCNTIPSETAPSAVHIPNGLSGVGGSALTNEYFSASWYELQILLNSGNHRRRGRAPLDWVYVIGRFRDLYAQTHQPEPSRLLVAVIKALQSGDPRSGPDDNKQGWRPDENVDPRIMVSPVWAPIFTPLATDVRRALAASLLAAWMDKNLQYPVSKYLPMSGLPASAYTTPSEYRDISGGKVWEASQQFREAGVAPELVWRLQQWGIAFNERAARLQYAGPPSISKK